MARSYHPDKNTRPHSASVFHVVQHAYDVIGNPEGRARYDAVRAGAVPHPPRHPPPSSHSGAAAPVPATDPAATAYQQQQQYAYQQQQQQQQQWYQQQQQQQQQWYQYQQQQWEAHTPSGRASAPPTTEAPDPTATPGLLPPVR